MRKPTGIVFVHGIGLKLLYLLVTLIFCSTAISPMARARSPVLICYRAAIKMPTVQQHYNWLTKNDRYGAGMAAEFLKMAKPYGDAYLKYQIRFLSEFPGGSGWFDIAAEIGAHESDAKTLKEWSCTPNDYPALVMVGLKLKSVRDNTIFVSQNLGNYDVVSIKNLVNSKDAIAVQIESSRQLLCADVRENNCEGVPAAILGKTYLPKEFVGRWSESDSASCAIQFTENGYTGSADGEGYGCEAIRVQKMSENQVWRVVFVCEGEFGKAEINSTIRLGRVNGTLVMTQADAVSPKDAKKVVVKPLTIWTRCNEH